MKNIILIILGAIIITAIAYSLWQEKYNSETFDLKLSLKAGESYKLKYTISQALTLQEVRQTLPPTLVLQTYTRPEMASLEAEMIVALDVKSVDADGTMDMDLFYKSIKVTIDSPPINIDTENMEPEDPNAYYKTAMMDIYLAMIGNKFRLKVGPTGCISNIGGFDELRARIDKKIDERSVVDINDLRIKDKKDAKEWKAMVEKSRREGLSDLYRVVSAAIRDDVTQMVESIIVRFSDWPVSAGDKWCEKSHLNIGFPDISDVNTTYKFKECKDGYAYIEAISELDMKKLKVTEVNYGDTVLKRMSGALVSFNTVDKDSGLLQKSEGTMKFSGIEKREPDRMSLPVRPTLSIPITFEGKVVIERIK